MHTSSKTLPNHIYLQSKENPKPLGVYDVVIAEDGMMFAKLF